MADSIAIRRPSLRVGVGAILPWALLAVAFAAVYWRPAVLLAADWWQDPEAGHGLLLVPVALWLAWKRGLVSRPRARPGWGGLLLLGAVGLRVVGELAAEHFTMRISIVAGLGALVVYAWGWRQVLAWWLPLVLLGLSVPLPELIRSGLALPLQFQASELGAGLLHFRRVPVLLAGNVIQLPGHQLFVTEACSGLRSLTALLAVAILIGGLWLTHWSTRVLLLAVAVPIAILINGVRVFLTGYLVYYVDPAMGQGFMHVTEGWLLFLVSLLLIALAAWGISALERLVRPRRSGD